MVITIPSVVMFISGALWFVWVVALPDNPSNPIPRFGPWFIDVCRILFAVSALVTLLGVTGKPIF